MLKWLVTCLRIISTFARLYHGVANLKHDIVMFCPSCKGWASTLSLPEFFLAAGSNCWLYSFVFAKLLLISPNVTDKVAFCITGMTKSEFWR